jgi:hypothetical protein
MYESTFDGIRFVEGTPPGAETLGLVSVEIGGVFTSSQLKSLDDVKRLMAGMARERGATAIVDFTYGQRSVGLLASIFSRDDVAWYGRGIAARIRLPNQR